MRGAGLVGQPDIDSPGDLTGYLRLLANDPGLVERMGRQARRVVVEEYDLKVAGVRRGLRYHGRQLKTASGERRRAESVARPQTRGT